MESLLKELQERQKELKCLYTIEEILRDQDAPLGEILSDIADALPSGFQYPEICHAQIQYEDQLYGHLDKPEGIYELRSEIYLQNEKKGSICIFYKEIVPEEDEGPFLKEERKLLDTVASRLSHFILMRLIKNQLSEWYSKEKIIVRSRHKDWKIILDLLKSTDRKLYLRILRKLVNFLTWSKIQEVDEIIHTISEKSLQHSDVIENQPIVSGSINALLELQEKVISLVEKYFEGQEIFDLIQKWIHEDKSLFLLETVESLNTSFKDIVDALIRFNHTFPEEFTLPESFRKALIVSLIRRIFTDQLEFISIAKNFVTVNDFIQVLPRIVYPADSHGKLGGKSSGLFLAEKIVNRLQNRTRLFHQIRTPKTWYITSDALLDFIHFNNLEEVIEEKYKSIEEVRLDYPQIIQIFKNSEFPPEIIKGLSLILEDIGENPIIVRSSSLLEDRLGTAFSGKYKSLFLANQGSFDQRLHALKDAIAEVYASVFGPDPIQYRAERNLLDFNEEMGVMIQQVVGKKVGPYFFPCYSGVAFSRNEFRWSPRIAREDGLVRMVPGLGTRAVDRLSDDYPILAAPAKPQLRVNTTVEEVLKYSPKKMDVLNLETNCFETVDIQEMIKKYGREFPNLHLMVSYFEDGAIRKPLGTRVELEKDMVITFDGLLERTNFMEMIHTLLKTLEEELHTPVDIEFACDGEHFYLLQCRPQSSSREVIPVQIPRDISKKNILFHTHKFISNGIVNNVRYIVYVVPQQYYEIERYEEMVAIGEIVGKLNKILPYKQFILIGPGRWGSRGDIKLGVKVTYADICNTAMLIEVAMKKGNYVPDLSFGTHFFQDLVEAGIKYLPVYPEEEHEYFAEQMLLGAPNELSRFLPEHQAFENVVRVVDVHSIIPGKVLKVVMNADLCEALGYLGSLQESESFQIVDEVEKIPNKEYHTRWRKEMVKLIAQELDVKRFGVKKMYLTGSTREENAGPGSDIDLIFITEDDPDKIQLLKAWLEGWGRSLAHINTGKTGVQVDNLIDAHILTERDLLKKDGFVTVLSREIRGATEIPLRQGE